MIKKSKQRPRGGSKRSVCVEKRPQRSHTARLNLATIDGIV